MERKIGLLFPGQGSQYVGMGKDLWDHFPAARAVFQEASDLLHEDVARLCFEGPEDRLILTANTQPAILTVSVAALRVLRSEMEVDPDCAAGHSLGEYGALVAAGALAFADAVVLVRQRGQFMQEAVPEGEGAMAALLGLDGNDVDGLCREHAGGRIVVAANYNAPGQVVISGHADAVERVSQAAKGRGVRKAVPLSVSAPFHSPLLAPAGARLRAALDKVQPSGFAFDVISNVDAVPYPSPDAIPDILARQVSHPVRWEACVKAIAARGVDLVIELGPRKVLTGLMKRIAPPIDTAQMEDTEGLRAVAKILT